MPIEEKKGIMVKVDAGLHAEVRAYIESHGMTMSEFVTLALTDELHPKFHEKEEKYMGNMRTIAFQVPEDLFQRIKDYLQRNNMTQKEFLLGLIEDELNREQTERERLSEDREDFQRKDEEEVTDEEVTAAVDDLSAVCEDGENGDESEEYDEDESEDEDAGFCMQM